ncbi:MAG: Wzz/FepE/Etk N-terminal domain-containing protein [bacterium]
MEKSTNESIITIRELIEIFRKKFKSILIFTILGFIISFIFYVFIANPIYLSTSVIKSTESSGGLSSLLTKSLPDLGDFGDLAGGGVTGQELSFFEKILLSRRCLEAMIIKFNLMEVYKLKYMKHALKFVREEIIEIKKDKVSGTMEIGVYDEDANRAKDINDFLLFQLNKINTELSVLDAKNKREYLEERYNIVRKDLKITEDSLIYFQNNFGISPDITIQAAVKSEIELEVALKSEEIKLEILRKILSPDEAEIKTQEEKIKLLTNQLADVKNSDYESGSLSLKGSPEVVMNFLRLKRDVEVQNKIMSIILPLFEQSKIEENRETPNTLILDNPEVPDYKDKPKRAAKILFFTFLTYVTVFSYFIIRYKWKQFRNRLPA